MMLILASNSPRRRQLLGLTGWEFEVHSAAVDERVLDGESADHYVRRTAELKARAALSLLPPVKLADDLVIACDTTVVDDGHILGKPGDDHEASIMLRRLRGREHQVYSALMIIKPNDGFTRQDLCVTDVPMREYSEDEIQAYVASGDPLDKAGAYAIQHTGFHPVENLSGCYTNVMGLPLCHLTRTLQQFDCLPLVNVPQACQMALSYDCLIYARILSGEL